jgi:hypothetical protein
MTTIIKDGDVVPQVPTAGEFFTMTSGPMLDVVLQRVRDNSAANLGAVYTGILATRILTGALEVIGTADYDKFRLLVAKQEPLVFVRMV